MHHKISDLHFSILNWHRTWTLQESVSNIAELESTASLLRIHTGGVTLGINAPETTGAFNKKKSIASNSRDFVSGTPPNFGSTPASRLCTTRSTYPVSHLK